MLMKGLGGVLAACAAVFLIGCETLQRGQIDRHDRLAARVLEIAQTACAPDSPAPGWRERPLARAFDFREYEGAISEQTQASTALLDPREGLLLSRRSSGCVIRAPSVEPGPFQASMHRALAAQGFTGLEFVVAGECSPAQYRGREYCAPPRHQMRSYRARDEVLVLADAFSEGPMANGAEVNVIWTADPSAYGWLPGSHVEAGAGGAGGAGGGR